MRHLVSFVLAGLLFSTTAFIYGRVFSYQPELVPQSYEPTFFVSTTTNPVISASAYAIFDTKTGEVLAGSDIDTPHPIASVTKLFTAVAILEKFNPESTTTITWKDVAGEGDSGKLHPREVYSYRELLFPLLLESSNDAADTLIHATKGELLPAMTALAIEYGATHTTLADASGLSGKNVSTVNDLIVFSRAAESKYPFIYDIGQLPQYIGKYTGWRNNNPVATADEYRGGKHGYTPAAGRTLVSVFDESFTSEHRHIGYVILGSDDLRKDTAVLRQFVADSVEFR